MTPKDKESPSGYLSSDDTEVVFVQWTRTEGSLFGSLQLASLSDDSSRELDNTNVPFTGVVSGKSVTLTIGGSFGSTSWSGQLNRDELMLTHPSSTGALETTRFHKASVDAFNIEVSRLRERSTTNAENAQRDATTAANERSAQSADADLTKSFDQLSTEVSQLKDAYSDIDAKVTAVNDAAQRTQNIQNDALRMSRVSPISIEAAYDAQSKAFDVQSASYDTDAARLNVEAIKLSVDGHSDSINKLIDKIKKQQQALDLVASAVPTHTATISADTVKTRIGEAEQARNAAVSVTTDKAKTAQSGADKTRRLSDDALAAADQAIKRAS